VSGTPSDSELKDAWDEILFEYAGRIKNEGSDYLFDLEKRIRLLEYHILYIDQSVDYLLRRTDPIIINEVRELGYDIPDLPSKEDINRVQSLAVTRVFELGELRKEFDMISKTTTGKKQTPEDFGETVSVLSKYMGFRIDKREIFLDEFTDMFNLYLKELAHNKKLADARRG
jgi:hypothetical protein